MAPLAIACIVEGHGEVQAVPILIRRIAVTIDPALSIDVKPPLHIPRSKLVRDKELERAVELATRKTGGRGSILDPYRQRRRLPGGTRSEAPRACSHFAGRFADRRCPCQARVRGMVSRLCGVHPRKTRVAERPVPAFGSGVHPRRSRSGSPVAWTVTPTYIETLDQASTRSFIRPADSGSKSDSFDKMFSRNHPA